MRLALLLLAVVAAAAAPAVHVEMPYRTIAGVQLRLDLAIPDSGPGPYPVIVCLHGGGWSMGGKGSFRKYLPDFARRGYAAAAIQYRLAPDHPYPAPVDDAHAAIRFLRANAKRWNLDPKRVTILGASAGAHLALLAGLENRSQVNAIVDISGPTDLRDWRMGPGPEQTLIQSVNKTSAILLSEFLGDTPAAEASPVVKVAASAPPVLIFHWKDDQAVAASQAERLIAALREAKVRHEAVWFEGRGHALSGKGVEELVPRTVEFLNRECCNNGNLTLPPRLRH